MSARYIVGDVRDVLATIPDGSIDLVLTSPPFLALRSYLPADHPDKHREIGSEPDPATFLDTLLLLTAEWRRVLAPHGSIAVELGDTYSGSTAEGSDTRNPESPRFRGLADKVLGQKNGPGYPLAKSLCMIPELYRVALAYGVNPLTGAESPAGRWRCRNVVRWHRPNPPVGALGDKFRPSTSDMVVACVSGKRYFDLDAVREAYKGNHKMGEAIGGKGANYGEGIRSSWSNRPDVVREDRGGAPPLDTWVIPTAPYAGSHYAVYPPALCEKPIKSMVPLKVCRTCGEPSRRIDGGTEYVDARGRPVEAQKWSSGVADGGGAHTLKPDGGVTAVRLEGGWTDCGHDDWRSGVVLDPFAGSGTTLMVATGHGRDAIGIDIDERNAELALERVGPLLLTVEHLSDGDDRAAS